MSHRDAESACWAGTALAMSVSIVFAFASVLLYLDKRADREIQVRQVQQAENQLAEQRAATEQQVLANGKLLVMLKRLDQLATVAERNL